MKPACQREKIATQPDGHVQPVGFERRVCVISFGRTERDDPSLFEVMADHVPPPVAPRQPERVTAPRYPIGD